MYEGRSRSNRTFAIIMVHLQIIINIIYEMKLGSFSDKSAEFQSNRLIDIKSAEQLVMLVPEGGAHCNVIMTLSEKHNRYNMKTNQNTKIQVTETPLPMVHLFLRYEAVLPLIKLKTNGTSKSHDRIFN